MAQRAREPEVSAHCHQRHRGSGEGGRGRAETLRRVGAGTSNALGSRSLMPASATPMHRDEREPAFTKVTSGTSSGLRTVLLSGATPQPYAL